MEGTVLLYSLSKKELGSFWESDYARNSAVAVRSGQLHSGFEEPPEKLFKVNCQVEEPKQADSGRKIHKLSGRDKILSEYPPITSKKQLQKYLQDFKSHYNEYRRLHAIVAKVSGKFAKLEQQLLSTKNGSRARKKVKRQIIQQYEESKKGTYHHKLRKRFQYLHEKLAHIKKMIADYNAAHST